MLSDRVRPGCEAAPWVCREIKELEKRIAELEAKVDTLTELTTNDGKEIGSYREGTGLRGENQALAKRIAELTGEYDEYDR